MIDDLQLISGEDIALPELKITLRQPKIKDIVRLGGENEYFMALSIFRLSKKLMNIQSPQISEWDVFNQAITQKIDGVPNTRTLVNNFLQLFFNHPIMIGPRSLILNGESVVSIEPEQFDLLKSNLLVIAGAHYLDGASGNDFNPGSKRAKEIADKIMKRRKKLAEQNKTSSKGFLARYIRCLAAVTSNSLESCLNMTMYQIDSVLKTYLGWEDFDLEIRKRLAGAKEDSKIEHWVARSIEKEYEAPMEQ